MKRVDSAVRRLISNTDEIIKCPSAHLILAMENIEQARTRNEQILRKSILGI
jgi:hypothetical protein